MIFKYITLTAFQPKKMYLGLAESEFKKQRYYNHTQSFRNENYSNSTTLSSYVWKIKEMKKITSTLVWEIIRITALYTNLTKRCSLFLHERLAIFMYPNQSELLNKRKKLVSMYWRENKFLFQMFNSNG